jgi:hypothetical protein
MADVRKKMMCNMIVDSSKNKISDLAKWIKIIGTVNLIFKPRSIYQSIAIG